ncbi:MAG: hypothetical protein JO127_15135 [Caulobacteraceae bacterium]|nr:hypothetical protein [Caulobacteraceae bacterium]
MRTFNLVIQDARSSMPTYESATARDPNAARRIAQERLEASPFHVGVQVRDDDEALLFWFRRIAPTAPAFAQQAEL